MPPLLAAAGRRIDAPDGPPRFPLRSLTRVRAAVDEQLRALRPEVVVASAACGADLIVLEAAAALDMRTRVVLPFPADAFRATSVTDRPGDWGPSFDRAIARAAAGNDLVVLEPPPGGWPDDTAAYRAAVVSILEEARAIAQQASAGRPGDEPAAALVIWDGRTRGADDLTEEFQRRAQALGFRTTTIDTR